MSETNQPQSAPAQELPALDEWLWLPDVAELLGVRGRDVRAMIGDHRLVALRRGPNNALAVNGAQFVRKDGKIVPLPALRGTLIQLADAGYNAEESLQWLMAPHAELGMTPFEGLRGEKTHAVRRAIQFLAF
ncbi:MAG: Rv2175c family DNA-binding protein [Arcanobacterium sp.]|nr:Rv2175c family DNA-binding protein [Arcanobacterium sp.]MDY5589354.1 Rv2175c family DNA-binding protein [Arcanobacterium sp.]